MIYRMQLADSVDEMTFDLLEVPIEDKDIEGTADNTTIDGNVFTDYLWLKKQFVQKWSLMCVDDYTQLRGFYTRQWENAEVPTYKLFVGENRSETLTASGSSFQIQNEAQYDAPLTLTEITGNATQDGTPTPDAPVAVEVVTGENVVQITGKNLLNAQGGFANKLINSAGGESNSNPCALFDGYIATQPSTAITLSFASSVNSMCIAEYTQDNTFIRRNIRNSASDYTITTQATTRYVRIYFNYDNSTTVSQTIIDSLKVQLELGSTATTYEPYQAQEFEINLGKNLLNPSDIAQGTWINPSIQNTCTFFLPIYTGQTITVSNKDTATWRFSMGLCETPHAGTNTQDTGWQTGTSKSLTAQSNGYLYVQLRKNDASNITPSSIPDDVYMVERGSQATAYAPYFTPIELAKIGTYQDRIYKDDGKWYIEKQIGKYTFDGTEGWMRSGNTTATHFVSALSSTNLLNHVQASYAGRASSLMTHFTYVSTPSQSTLGANEGLYALYNQTNGIVSTLAISLDINDAPDIATARTWITNHNPSLYYPLATPTTTEITDSTLLAQLNFIANLYGGTNNIMLVGTGAQGEIEVQYTLFYEKEQVIIPETPVRLNLTDGGVINPCGCRQNVQLTMRETVQ